MANASDDLLFTIGHSTHTQQQLLALLQQHGITAVCDVRSRPFSRMNPQFNRDQIKDFLMANGVQYVFLGEELGARSSDPASYRGGKVRYERLAETSSFQRGLKRVREGMSKYRVVLMCAEKEPLECHRTILVARHLSESGIDVQHIHADGRLESQEDALVRLAQMLDVRLDEHHLFCSREELLAETYRLQEDRIAYEQDQDTSSQQPLPESTVPGSTASESTAR